MNKIVELNQKERQMVCGGGSPFEEASPLGKVLLGGVGVICMGLIMWLHTLPLRRGW